MGAMARRISSGIAFLLIGALIYAAIYSGAEMLLFRNGHANPFFKIATANEKAFDWVILGASHAMPLDFADFNDYMHRETGRSIINLASPGSGPLYNRFVFEAFLNKHSARNVLYVVDSFAFYSRSWNEDRFADAKLLRTTPLAGGTAVLLWHYCWRDSVDPRALLDYLTGFSKINNRDRFKKDVWEGELQWDRVYRSSASATRDRVAYLYPKRGGESALPRYLTEFERLLDIAKQRNVRVIVVKLPVPAAFRAALVNETAFDDALRSLLFERGILLLDLSSGIPDIRFYFDTDHLNRAGVRELFDRHLKAILTGD
jgi:hypothetical protein